MRFLSVNADCFLIELSSLEQTLALYAQLKAAHYAATQLKASQSNAIHTKAAQFKIGQFEAGQINARHGAVIQELIPAAKTILVYFDRLRTDLARLQSWISGLDLDQHLQQDAPVQIIPICYQGEDLAQVAEQQGLSVAEVIRRHQHSTWQVAFIGFAPGFAYLNSPDQPFVEVPRLAVPRKKIPVGSLGLAGSYSGIYPKDSPGGWQLIGSTSEKMWDLERINPALLLPGMQVHFEDVTHNPTTVAVSSNVDAVAQAHQTVETESSARQSTAQAVFKITAASLQMLMQDQGRLNQTALGVGTAGAMDQAALHSANRIVGNAIGCAAIEILNGGFAAQILQPAIIAITGAHAEIRVQYATGQVATFEGYQAIALDQGDELQIKRPSAGLRNYIALRGGFALQAVLNSYSYDSLAQLGPAPLQLGDQLYPAQAKSGSIQVDQVPLRKLPQVGDCVVLDIVMGPRDDWFDAESLDRLCSQSWLVTQDSNRVGLRLQGAEPLTRRISHELESEGTCTGALQIPPSGQPVLFMNDHPLTGGYPVIAAVAPHHWDLVAQIPAGCQIKFNQYTADIQIENAS
ncbi:allophanate hydrolase [Acinetobacter calcoaceticus]|uniref:Allophanate hydrolase n=1 Tax=Acinetobacter calcoaceticus TaxID=471 RepID=A0A4R1XAS8_ACICA|nr:allophanate hydrolase [Acinetobacter calcoaceticus]